MQRINTLLRMCGIVGVCGLAALALPRPAHAGGVHISLGFGLPVPVFVAPPPAVVYPAPSVYVQPAPVVVVQPPVVYGQPYSRGYASYGGYGRSWRHRHYDDGDHTAHRDYRRPNGGHGWRR